MRVHPEPIGDYRPPPHTGVAPHSQPAPTVLFVVPEVDRWLYAGDQFTRVYAHTGGDATKLLAVSRPRTIVLDWDDASLEGPGVCAAARASSNTSVLVTTEDVKKVPSILRAGCHGVLLKPFARNLLAARLGRVVKETEQVRSDRPLPPGRQSGTNRVWPETACPNCGVRGTTSFDFSSYRRMWYACLSCDNTWLGPRKE